MLKQLKRAVPRALFAATAAGVTAAALTCGGASAQPSSSTYIDHLGRPTPHTQRLVTDFANQPGMPPQVRDALLGGLKFVAGTGDGDGGAALPSDAPRFRQAFWPTISPGCMGPGMNSTGTLIAVPGPARIPKPAPGPGQATFVFTALGTPAAARDQGAMNVYWVNLANQRTGVTPIGNKGINPTGPATLSGVANTGPGLVLAVVDGAVKTTSNRCHFAPTAIAVDVK